MATGQRAPEVNPGSPVIFRMSDENTFLLDAAERLRQIAQGAPEIADALRRLADELEARAAKRGYDRRRVPRS